MRREVFTLAVASAADAYLFYYVLASGGDYFAGVCVGLLSLYFINRWSQLFYRLGLGS